MNILQIGCHNGNDEVYNFCLNNKDFIQNIFLVDANKNALEQCKDQYKEFKQAKFFNLAILPDTEIYNIFHKIEFYVPRLDPLAQQGSVLKDHLINHSVSELDIINVEATTINNFLSKLNCNINRLYMDIEGFDLDVILSVDFNIFLLDYIEFESLHSEGTHTSDGPKLQNCTNFLESLGYKIERKKWNCIASRLDK